MPLKTPKRLVAGLGVVAMALIVTLLGVDTYNGYARELAIVKEQLRIESLLLAEHAEFSIRAADLVLARIASDMRRVGLEALADDRSYWESMRDTLEDTPQLATLVVADASGKAVLASAVPSFVPIDVSDRDYFEAHLAGQPHYIGAPIIARDTGREMIPVSVRLAGEDGQFQGVAGVAMDVAYFYNFHRSLLPESGRRIGIHLDDGTVLSSYPSVSDPISIDKAKRIVSAHMVNGYPVGVFVEQDYGEFLSSFYPLWLRRLIIFLVLSAGVAAAGFLLIRSLQRADSARDTQLAMLRKQRHSERLSRAITRHIPNGRVAVLNRELRYLFADGQEFSDHERLAPDKVIGRTIRELHSARIAATLESLALAAFTGSESEDEITIGPQTYRVVAVPLEDDEANVDEVLLLTQDISVFKNTQRELQERNSELHQMSFTDALMAIPNRRAFDHELNREWRRAARKQQTLSLLMVDIDYFKYYNDHYGHAAGDDCLKKVAAVLDAAILRPGDVVARYGGEEMAVLLPETDIEGALEVAGRIQSLLVKEGIPFSDSPGGNFLTVSIGAGAVMPAVGVPPTVLIEKADDALYQAKNAGRNQAASSEYLPS